MLAIDMLFNKRPLTYLLTLLTLFRRKSWNTVLSAAVGNLLANTDALYY